MKHLDGLNEAQLEAVIATEGPLMIVAGAGAGKTKTITHRILELIHKGIDPDKILAITFTNKAASEMRERVMHAIGDMRLSTKPFISTFHALGVHILKENAREVGITRHFTILDESDAVSMIKESIREEGLDPKEHEPRKYKYVISKEKGDFFTQEEYAAKVGSAAEELYARIWARYEIKKKKENALDFDDLLLKSVLLLKKNPEIKKSYQSRWKYVHIDEYQDTNQVQYELSKLLVGEERHICVVGDTDQNIYSWRGANLKNMLRFEKDYPNAKIVFLEQNYRSTSVILEAANTVIQKNTVRVPKNLFTLKEGGEKITLKECFGEIDEAHFVAETASSYIRDGVEASDIAVLYRANFQSRVIEEAMLDIGLPYQVLGTKFFDRKEIKDMLSYIRASLNRDSLSDIRRIINTPVRGIGKTTMLKVMAGDTESLPPAMKAKIKVFYEKLEAINNFAQFNVPSEIIKFTLSESGIEDAYKAGTEEEQERLENIKELVTLATRYDSLGPQEGLDALLTSAALASDQDTLEGAGAGVKLMTVHAAKGLEFKVVFIVGLEEGLFPHERAGQYKKTEEAEEERRLFYVAITRAKEKLYLTYATTRTIYGMRQINSQSSFISDIPAHLINFEQDGQSGILKTIFLD
ncbi:UvrD-helicase domain-containing protein [Candidatus Nomurabacteria bacterium]|nr:MAG: UvrD-helicase domain-containing protein [Candidatus Nomurabacteria bacterium]